jgi:hypothetical protein
MCGVPSRCIKCRLRSPPVQTSAAGPFRCVARVSELAGAVGERCFGDCFFRELRTTPRNALPTHEFDHRLSGDPKVLDWPFNLDP